MTEEEIFDAVLQVPREKRALYLQEVCPDDSNLRSSVEHLLRIAESTNDFLNRPAVVAAYGIEEMQPGSRIGPYEIVELIGRGGMGIVFRAIQHEPVKRAVALKVIKPGLDTSEVVSRFRAEQRALALMDHPHVAKVLQAGATTTGRPYFAMELVQGTPITEFCTRENSPLVERLKMVIDVCSAIQHAHSKSIIHRDIKPSNILVASVDGRPVPKVIDFGLAKALDMDSAEQTALTKMTQIVGTPMYMSPEQTIAGNADIDTRTDIYSLGVVLYELVTGTTPFDRERLNRLALDEVRQVIRDEETPKPSAALSTLISKGESLSLPAGSDAKRLCRMIRGDLDWIILKAMEKDRERRYLTVNDLAADLQRFLAHEPVLATPPSAAYRLAKFVRRNQVQVIAASLVFITLIAGIIGTSLGLIEAQTQAARATAEAGEKELARRAEAEQREKAERAFLRTADVLDAMVSETAGTSLMSQTQLNADQKKFLTQVLEYYQELVSERDDQASSQARIAFAAYNLGVIEYRLGRKTESAQAFQTACELYEKLAQHSPGDELRRRQWANALSASALVNGELGNTQIVELHLRKSSEISEQLVVDFPNTPLHKICVARNMNALATHLASRGETAELEAYHRRAVALVEEVRAQHPEQKEALRDLGVAYSSLALYLSSTSRIEESIAASRQSIAYKEQLIREFPDVAVYQQELARSLNNLGTTFLEQNQFESAIEQYLASIAIKEQLIANFPSVPDYYLELGRSHNNMAAVFSGQNRIPEALEQGKKAMDIYAKLAQDYPAVAKYKIDLGGCLANLGFIQSQAKSFDQCHELCEKGIEVLTPLFEQDSSNVLIRKYLKACHEYRSIAFYHQTRPVDSLREAEAALAIAPDNFKEEMQATVAKLKQIVDEQNQQ